MWIILGLVVIYNSVICLQLQRVMLLLSANQTIFLFVKEIGLYISLSLACAFLWVFKFKINYRAHEITA